MGAPALTCRHVLALLLSLQLLLVAPWQGETAARALNFTRQDFPRDFVFGAGTSAYQVNACIYTTQELHGEALALLGAITQLEKFL
jgi:hypothetical protein